MQFKITGLDAVRQRLDASAKSIAYGLSKGINDTLYGLQVEMKKEIRDSFDRPTPYIMKSVQYTRSTNETLTGSLYISSKETGKGALTPSQILMPHIFGGNRFVKNSERLLRRIGVLGSSQFITPGSNAPLDSYGNISGNDMVKILSAAGLFDTRGFAMNQTAASRKKKRFFGSAYCIPYVGVFWRVTANTSYPVLIFTNSAPNYEAGRFDFYSIAEDYIKNTIGENLRRSITYALISAR